MRLVNLILLIALIGPVAICVDRPVAAWAAALPTRLADNASTLSSALFFLGLAVAGIAVVTSLVQLPADFALGLHRQRKGTAMLVAVSAAGSLVSALILKHVVGRIRPSTQGAEPWRFEFMAFNDDFAAWPSVHAAVAAALVLSLSMQLPSLRLPLLIVGVAACIARLLVGVHWPSDVLSGWALGAAMVAVSQLGLTKRRLRHGARRK